MVKTRLQARTRRDFFYEREIWWAAIGHNIGDEEDGKGIEFVRPVLVLRKFNSHLFWGIALTTTFRTGKYYINFTYRSNVASTAILSQLRIYDSKRLMKRDGIMSQRDFALVQLKLVKIIRNYPQK